MSINENLNDKVVALEDEALEAVVGGRTYIEGNNGNSYVRTGPALYYKAIGTLYRGDDARFLNETAVDERGVIWYMIRWNGREAWVSARYTKKVNY